MSASIESPHFLLRRLHSLFGFLPIGAFLMFHMWENSQARFGMAHYNEEVVGALQRMNYLVFLEIFAIALPLLFHAVYGLVILGSGKPDVRRYPYWHNRLYLLQRLSGVGILLFLFLHVGWTRIWSLWEPAVKANLFEHMQLLLSNPLTLSAYVLGLLLSVFHLGNGLWTMGISWGVTVTPRAQRISFAACMALSLLLAAMGLHGLWGFLA
jgi:succinate dehydrogenase / fumarate reductase cytochrome b subunit